MILKKRQEPGELKLLRMLNARMELENVQHLQNLEKGYEGELWFDGWLEKIVSNCLVINDLLLEYGGTLFQIDSLVISPENIYLFEVKNYEGDYYTEKERWYAINKNEIKDPLLQLKRSDSLFRRLLRDLGFHSPQDSLLMFVNPEFQLYHSTPNLPIVYFSQLNRYHHKFKKQISSGRLTTQHSRLAEKLLSLHIEESPYKRLPDYRYEDLRKGVFCVGCGGMTTHIRKKSIICTSCPSNEDYETVIISNIDDFIALFPEEKISSKAIYDWLGETISIKTIQRILVKNFKQAGHGKSSHYFKKGN